MDAQFNWFFDSEVKSCIYVPAYLIKGFQNKNWLDNLADINEVSYRPHVISAQCIIGIEKLPEAGVKTEYANHEYSEAYGQLVSCLRHSSKDITLNNTKPNTISKVIILSNYTYLIYITKAFLKSSKWKKLRLVQQLLMVFRLVKPCMQNP